MNALIYPIYLDPVKGDREPPEAARVARTRMQQLADASGGWLFAARSADDLDPVYGLVEKELRSVYSLAYYPRNQSFDGEWRSVEVKVKRPGAAVRTRAGYVAK
jgi:VWFA-related protein